MIHFVYAEDYGWGFELCAKNKCIGSFNVGYDDEAYMDGTDFFQIRRDMDKEGFENFLKAEGAKFEVLRRYLDKEEEALF